MYSEMIRRQRSGLSCIREQLWRHIYVVASEPPAFSPRLVGARFRPRLTKGAKTTPNQPKIATAIHDTITAFCTLYSYCIFDLVSEKKFRGETLCYSELILLPSDIIRIDNKKNIKRRRRYEMINVMLWNNISLFCLLECISILLL